MHVPGGRRTVLACRSRCSVPGLRAGRDVSVHECDVAILVGVRPARGTSAVASNPGRYGVRVIHPRLTMHRADRGRDRAAVFPGAGPISSLYPAGFHAHLPPQLTRRRRNDKRPWLPEEAAKPCVLTRHRSCTCVHAAGSRWLASFRDLPGAPAVIGNHRGASAGSAGSSCFTAGATPISSASQRS